MPNYCQNNLTITNLTNEQAKEITNAINEGKLLEHFVPYPEGLDFCVARDLEARAANVEKYGAPEGWSWRIEHWGTKWDIVEPSDVKCDDTATSVGVFFLTAWNPPLIGLQRISKLFPEAEFSLKYLEEGMDFIGVSLIKDGVIRDYCTELSPILNKVIAVEHPEFFDEDGEVLEDEDDAFQEYSSDVMYDIVEDSYDQLLKELPDQGVTLEASAERERQRALKDEEATKELIVGLLSLEQEASLTT